MYNKNIENSKLFYLLIFLSSFNFVEKGNIFSLLLIIYMVLKLRLVLTIDKNNTYLCLLFGFFSITTSLLYFSFDYIIKCLIIVFSYLCAVTIFKNTKNIRLLIERVCFSIFLGYSLQLILVYLYNMYKGQPSARTMFAIWNEGLISVTIIALLSSIVIGYSFYGIFCNRIKKVKWLSLISLAFVILINMKTSTRTPFLLLLIVFISLTVVYKQKNIFRMKKNNLIIMLIMVIIGVFLMLIYISVFQFDFTKISIIERFLEEGFKSTRLNIAIAYIQNMLCYPFGGGLTHLEIGKYAHNILLEIFDLFGFIPFLVILLFHIQGIKNMMYIAKYGVIKQVNILLIGLYLAIIIEMSLEPVFEGYPMLLYTFVFLHGILVCYVDFSKRSQYERNENL